MAGSEEKRMKKAWHGASTRRLSRQQRASSAKPLACGSQSRAEKKASAFAASLTYDGAARERSVLTEGIVGA